MPTTKLLWIGILCLCLNSELSAQGRYKTNIAFDNSEKTNFLENLKKNISESRKKISSDLLPLMDPIFLLDKQDINSYKNQLKESKNFIGAGESSYLKDSKKGDMVYIYIYLKSPQDIYSIDSMVVKVTDRDQSNSFVTAWVEVNKLDSLAALDRIRGISTVIPPIVEAGSVTTEGDVIHRTNQVRSRWGQSGAGMKVGIISDGVSTRAASQATGDLPADGAGLTVLSNVIGGNEGTAMLEIVHDMVPNTQLYFHDGGNNTIQFNTAIDNLVAAGCNVICDDIGWIDQPFFEDGSVASHLTSVLSSNNIVYVSSAGNAGQRHYQGDFYPQPSPNTTFHDFSAGGNTGRDFYINMDAGSMVTIVLQWNDKFGTSGNDYDLYLYRESSGSIVASSTSVQNGSGNPLEILTYSATASGDYDIRVKKYSGVAKTLEVFIYTSGSMFVYTNNRSSVNSIFGHKAVPGVMAVGAISATNPGNNTIEPFSSQGPVTISYPSPQTRNKPDICGIDGVSVTGAGGFANPFYGTSAAAPHIAAIAAQLWAQLPSKTGNEIRDMIKASAVDLGTTGFDYIYGNGRADAVNAFNMFGLNSPNGLVVTDSPSQTIVIKWRKNTEPDFLRYRIYRGTSPSPTIKVDSTTGGVTDTVKTFNGMTNGTRYYLRITAVDSAGNESGFSNEVNAAPGNIPLTPQSLVVTDSSSHTIALQWRRYAVPSYFRYRIYRGTSPNPTAKVDSTTGGITDTSKTFNGLTNGIRYYLRVTAIDSAGHESGFSNEVNAAPGDRVPPAPPQSLIITDSSSQTIALKWRKNTESDFLRYRIYRGTSPSPTTKVDSTIGGISDTSKMFKGLVNGTRYYIRSTAVDSAGNESGFSNEVTTIPNIAAPQNLIVTDSSNQTITLKWRKNTEPNFLCYRIYRNTSPSPTIKVDSTIGGIADTSKTFKGLANGTRYYLRITAVDSSGNESGYSNQVNTVPNIAAPQNLIVTDSSSQTITLKWRKNTGSNFLRYRIYRNTTPSPTTKVDSTTGGITDTSKTFIGLTNGTRYYLRITAVDNTGIESGYSNEVFTTPNLAAPRNLVVTDSSSHTIAIKWRKNTETNLISYFIYRDTSPSPIRNVGQTTGGLTDTSITFTGLTNGTRYYLRITAVDNNGNESGYSNEVNAVPVDRVAPAPPQSLVITDSTSTIFTIKWQKNAEPDFMRYRIYRNTSPSPTTKVDSTTGGINDTSKTFTGLLNGTKYYFRVTAIDNSGNESGYSNEVRAITTSVERNSSHMPATFSLEQNYPNPFNPTTVINYQLAGSCHVTVRIYDMLGRETAMLVDEQKSAGIYTCSWNATKFPSGLYFYRLQAGPFIGTKKLILLK